MYQEPLYIDTLIDKKIGGRCPQYLICVSLLSLKQGGFMEKRSWGKTVTKYCPKSKVCWSVSKTNKLVVYKDLPTYGLEREEIPKQLKQGGV